MGFIKAFAGAISSTYADQWKEYFTPKKGVSATAAIFQAVPQAGNGENYKGNSNVITNGSKIVVPEGTALVTLQDGQITGFIAESGGYEFKSDDPNSKSFFAGEGAFAQVFSSTWEKFKYGGTPATQQLAFYVNLKEISGIRFGTQTPIQWNDSCFGTKVGAMMRGTYSIKIEDPILFIKQFLPIEYTSPNAKEYDFNDINDSTNALLDEFTSSLSAGITNLSMTAAQMQIDTYDYISSNRLEFAKEMNTVLDSMYGWRTNRGLQISNISIQMEYDEKTKELQSTLQQDDLEIRKAQKMAAVYSNNMAGAMAAASGEAMKNAAGNENGAMMGFMGMNMAQNTGNSMLGAVANMQQPMMNQQMMNQPMMNQQVAPQPVQTEQTPVATPQVNEDPTEKLLNAKKLLDAGAISQEEYDQLKAKYLGI